MRYQHKHHVSSKSGQTILLIIIFIVTLLMVFAARSQKLVEIEQTVVERSRLDRAADNGYQNVTQWARWLLEQDARLEEAEKTADENYVAIDSLFDNWSSKGPEAPHFETEVIA